MKYRSAALLAGLVMVSSTAGVKAGIRIVGTFPGEYATVTAAVAAARPGDTIRVRSGQHAGPILLNKPVTLEGIGRPVLRGSGRGSVVLVTAGGCAIRGFVIEHCGGDLQNEDSGILLRSDRNRVEDNELHDILYGIYLYRSQGNTIRRNVIRGRRELEVGSRGAGIHFWLSPANVVEENTITETRDGMYIQNSSDNVIRRNRISRLRYGLHYMYSDANHFEGNHFTDSFAGAAIMYSRNIVFRRNVFLRNRGFSSFAILFQDCDACLAEGNFIIDNTTGIFMESLRNSVIRNNAIAGNDVALMIFASSEGNLLTGNNFIRNHSPLQLVGSRTDTRWEEKERGNHWSDYDGYDLDGDSVGDVPHRVQNVFEYLEGNHPRLRLFLHSSAAQAMVLAEKTFPIVRGSPEVDKNPLMDAVPLRNPFPEDRLKPRVDISLLAASLLMLSIGLAALRGTGAGRRP